MINQKVIVITTPGAYRLQINEATPVRIDAYVWGGGGGGGASSDINYSAYGTGGSFVHYSFVVSPTDVIKLAVGGGGQGGRITNASPTSPYGSVTGVYGGGSFAGYTGGPSGGLTQVPLVGTFGTGGGGGGASVILVNNFPKVVAAGGGGGGGGFEGNYVSGPSGQSFTYTRSGTASDSNSLYFNGMIYGSNGYQSASGGGGGGGITNSAIRNNGVYYPQRDISGGGKTENESIKPLEGSIGYGGSIGYSCGPVAATISGPDGRYTTVNTYNPSGEFGKGGRPGLSGKVGISGNSGAIILVITQDGGTGFKIGNVWKDVKNSYFKVDGNWKNVQKIYVKDNGTWKKVFGTVDTTLSSISNEYSILEPAYVSAGAVPAPPPGAQIYIYPTSLTFNVSDNVQTDFPASFAIQNTGNQILSISNVQFLWNKVFPPELVEITPYGPGQSSLQNVNILPGDSISCGALVKGNVAGTGTGFLTVYSNAVGNIQKSVPVTVNVAGANAPVISGYQYYTLPGSYTFTVPTGVTQVTVAVQGPGANGGTGEYASGPSSYPFTANAGGGGGNGELQIQTLSVTSGGTYNVVVGGPGTASVFSTITAASGTTATGALSAGSPGYGGRGTPGPVITVLANSISVSSPSLTSIGSSGNGAGGMTSANSSYITLPGEGQGFSLINTGANGWSGQGPGSGGGGGGADEGAGPGVGGGGQAGYVKIFWGENAYPYYNSAPYSLAASTGEQGQSFTWT